MSAAGLAPPVERTLRVLPSILYLIFTWSASSQTAGAFPAAFPDKLVHFGEYGLLALLLLFAFTAFDAVRVTPRALALTAAIAIAWGVLDEYHQSFVPTRDSSALDLLADALGTAAVVAGVAILARRERRGA